MRRLAAALLAAGAAACAGPREPEPFEGPAAPLPYTVEELRASNAPVTTVVYRIEQPDQPRLVQTRVFLSDDGEVVRLLTTTSTEDGERGDQFDLGVPWTRLRDLARFPEAATVRAEERVAVAAGEFDCWRYDVDGTWREEPAHYTYWFDRATAGSPVLQEIRRGEAVVFRMELVEHDRRPLAAAAPADPAVPAEPAAPAPAADAPAAPDPEPPR